MRFSKEVDGTEIIAERTEKSFGFEPDEFVAGLVYGAGHMPGRLVDRWIEPRFPERDKSHAMTETSRVLNEGARDHVRSCYQQTQKYMLESEFFDSLGNEQTFVSFRAFRNLTYPHAMSIFYTATVNSTSSTRHQQIVRIANKCRRCGTSVGDAAYPNRKWR